MENPSSAPSVLALKPGLLLAIGAGSWNRQLQYVNMNIFTRIRSSNATCERVLAALRKGNVRMPSMTLVHSSTRPLFQARLEIKLGGPSQCMLSRFPRVFLCLNNPEMSGRHVE